MSGKIDYKNGLAVLNEYPRPGSKVVLTKRSENHADAVSKSHADLTLPTVVYRTKERSSQLTIGAKLKDELRFPNISKINSSSMNTRQKKTDKTIDEQL